MKHDRDHDYDNAERAISVKNHEQYTAQSAGVQFGVLPERLTNIPALAAEIRKPPAKLHPWRRGPSCQTNKALRSYKKIKADRVRQGESNAE